MIITIWNIRGLNSKGKQRYLKERLKRDKPSIMLIQETKVQESKLKAVMNSFKPYYEIIGQDAIGSAGGVAILWNLEEVHFEAWTSTPRILSGRFRPLGSQDWILLSNVYGPHIQNERRTFLQNLTVMRSMYPESPWIVGGDFNMIKALGEKRGELRRTEIDMEAFGDWTEAQRLVDIQTINGIHTWNNMRGGRHQIASRLDRFLLSEQIMNWDIFIEAEILPGMGSDHWPIKVELDIKASPKKKPFRFEAFWLRDKNFMKKVEEWWKQSSQIGRNKMQTFQMKLKELKGNIKK